MKIKIMKTFRIISVVIGLSLSMSTMAQKTLTEDGTKAQKELVEHLRTNGLTPSIDTRDNSVCFKSNDIFYWVTFEDKSPVLYTIHRKGLKFDNDSHFKPSCARAACNEVNSKHKIKCIYNEKQIEKKKERRIDFIMQTYAKEPSDFHGGFRKMLAAFKDVDVTFKSAYDKAYDQWKKDSIAKNAPIIPQAPTGSSVLKVTDIAFGNFDAGGNVISDYNQPLRKSACKFIKASMNVSAPEKGIFKIGMKIVNPNGKAMLVVKGFEYCSTANVEIIKPNKPQECILAPYGSDEAGFWNAGEYKVEIYDVENGSQLYSTTFNIL